jgi:hypothetical protein
MHGFAFAFLGLTLAADPIELPKDVHEIQTRQFAMPVGFRPDLDPDKIETIRLFVSEDQGKTWKREKDFKPSDKLTDFTAPHDGLYWFAVQVVLKNGDSEPTKLDDLVPARKVYVNSKGSALKAQKSYEELRREIKQLRMTVEQLQKRIEQLESERKAK